MLGKHDAADALKECEVEPDEATRLTGVALALHALGRTAEARAALQALVGKYGSELPAYVATVYAYRREMDPAYEWLEKAAATHDPNISSALTVIVKHSDSVISNPRRQQDPARATHACA